VSGLALDRLAPGAAIDVVVLDGDDFGGAARREPHRHDYHELIWVRRGGGEHAIDDAVVPVRPGTVTVIGRGQVHVFREASDLHGAVLRFRDELLLGGAARIVPGWLLDGGGGRTIPVPAGEADRLDGIFGAVHAELRRPPDGVTADLERHFISILLLWLERWYDGSRTEHRAGDDADVQLQRRFAERLETDFARHHDAAHYADALAVPAAALSRALTEVTGRSTKDLIVDRVMLEAARLLRYTEATVGEVAHRVGFTDPLYFSRAFKRRFGEAPQAYRDRVRGRGKSMHP
jgi:AraC family transcriptional regulator, transcriptional activator of pobA